MAEIIKKSYRNETAVKKTIRELLEQHNWFHWNTPANGFGASGISDRLAYRDGVLLAIEVKFGKNKPTALQKSFLSSILAESGFGFVVNETTLPVFQTWLEAFDRATGAVEKETKPTDEDGALMLDCIRTLTEAIV